jgi:hypothetical protein
MMCAKPILNVWVTVWPPNNQPPAHSSGEEKITLSIVRGILYADTHKCPANKEGIFVQASEKKDEGGDAGGHQSTESKQRNMIS